MKVHLIAIGGSAMHNLAIALHQKGFSVTGSDDEIFEPSRSRLSRLGLMPLSEGWFPEKINFSLDAVILGMHARANNPELLRAQQLGLKIYSYPEYIYEQTRDKIRVVIGGSHGKTSITAMVLHALKHVGRESDFMVGAQLDGFDCMVRLTSSAPLAVIEGDEYLSSPIDRRPKFHLYSPNIALLSGIAWDHINVFPTFENYVEQFRIFLDVVEPGGTVIYCSEDPEVKDLVEAHPGKFTRRPYFEYPHTIRDGVTYVQNGNSEVPLRIFGRHNLQNLSGALAICSCLGISAVEFLDAIVSFGGASRRLELVKRNAYTSVYKDFAHSPSKLKATTSALKEQHKERKLVACMELHTFSSLNAEFLSGYRDSMNAADEAIVYFNPHTIEHKKLPPITPDQVRNAFARDDIRVFTDSSELITDLRSHEWKNSNLLLMTSGNFDGVDFAELATDLLS
jgi:UDP-N-acetylmuramate: L-alanyl-gamma-D-glutamyl-meso-diaminopimelate ligase